MVSFQKRAGFRKSVFLVEEQPIMKPLPPVGCEISTRICG